MEMKLAEWAHDGNNGRYWIDYQQRHMIFQISFIIPFRTIIHEFMHGFGRMHLHQRWDRDNYIWIDTSKISQGWESQFTLLSKSQYPDYGVAYDGKSIMSYHGGDVIHSRVSYQFEEKISYLKGKPHKCCFAG